MRVYLDLAVVLNALVDFFLLMGTNALAGFPCGWKRNLPAAALGGLYGGACLLPGLSFLGGIFWRVVFLGLMASAAFGWNRGSLRRTGVFLLLSMALGGIAVGFGQGRFFTIALSGAAVWLLCRMAFGGTAGGQTYVPVVLRCGDREVKVLALRDTGNSLRDPVTGDAVLILACEAAQRLTGLTEQQIASPVETLTTGTLPGLRLIPYRAVGQGGLLLGMKLNCVIDGRESSTVVAFDPGGLGKETMYQALTGGV